MTKPIEIDPPIIVPTPGAGPSRALATVADVIAYVRHHDDGGDNWAALRDAAFVAAAMPTQFNIEALRRLAAQAFTRSE